MGIRGELFSTQVQAKNRTYFFNVKENRHGDLYLNIVESKSLESGSGFERQSIVLFSEDMQGFLKGFDDSLKVFEKNIHERKRNAAPDGRKPYGNKPDGKKTYGRKSDERKPDGRRPERKPGAERKVVRVRARREGGE